jgi:hypothetical protein
LPKTPFLTTKSKPLLELAQILEIKGANGAFSVDTGKIYLSEELVNGGNIWAIATLKNQAGISSTPVKDLIQLQNMTLVLGV